MTNDMLTRCLDDLERRLDPAQEDRLLSEWRGFCEGRADGEIFSPRRVAAPPSFPWPSRDVNAAINDPGQMLLFELGILSDLLASRVGNLPAVRSNYGTGILPSLFGADIFMMDERCQTLPTSVPLGNADAIRRLVENGAPSLDGGFGARVFGMVSRFRAAFEPYPNVRRYVTLYHPDLQGPLDVAELLWGSDIFYAFYDEPDLVHGLLSLLTETYMAFMRRWESLVPPRPEHSVHWYMMHRGRICIRNDSAMNLSPGMYAEFSVPYDRRLLAEFGGMVHACGRVDHYIEHLAAIPGLQAANFSQPHLNNMEAVYAHTVDRGIRLLNLNANAARDAQARGRSLRGLVHVAA